MSALHATLQPNTTLKCGHFLSNLTLCVFTNQLKHFLHFYTLQSLYNILVHNCEQSSSKPQKLEQQSFHDHFMLTVSQVACGRATFSRTSSHGAVSSLLSIRNAAKKWKRHKSHFARFHSIYRQFFERFDRKPHYLFSFSILSFFLFHSAVSCSNANVWHVSTVYWYEGSALQPDLTP